MSQKGRQNRGSQRSGRKPRCKAPEPRQSQQEGPRAMLTRVNELKTETIFWV